MIKILIAFAIGAALWRLGGWGQWLGKAPRRYILPALIALYAFTKRKKWTTAFILPTLIGLFSLGYGESKPYWYKFLVGCSWVVPRFIFLGFSWFAVCVPFIWITLFWLSNNPKTSKYFKWWLCEVITGGSVGIAYC